MSHLPEWTLVILRSVFILIMLFAITKWLGKRQISQLSFFEYIAGMTIGDIAAQVSTGLDQKFFHGVFAIYGCQSDRGGGPTQRGRFRHGAFAGEKKR